MGGCYFVEFNRFVFQCSVDTAFGIFLDSVRVSFYPLFFVRRYVTGQTRNGLFVCGEECKFFEVKEKQSHVSFFIALVVLVSLMGLVTFAFIVKPISGLLSEERDVVLALNNFESYFAGFSLLEQLPEGLNVTVTRFINNQSLVHIVGDISLEQFLTLVQNSLGIFEFQYTPEGVHVIVFRGVN